MSRSISTLCCPLMLDSTSVRLSYRSNRALFPAWATTSAVSTWETREKQGGNEDFTTSPPPVDPWSVSIHGPDTVFPERLSKFTCVTSCTINVDCTVKWRFRDGFPIGSFLSVHENELSWTPSIPGTFQNFTCIAENVAAGRSAEATKEVQVQGTNVHSSICYSSLTSQDVVFLNQAGDTFVMSPAGILVSGSEALQLRGLSAVTLLLLLLLLSH